MNASTGATKIGDEVLMTAIEVDDSVMLPNDIESNDRSQGSTVPGTESCGKLSKPPLAWMESSGHN